MIFCGSKKLDSEENGAVIYMKTTLISIGGGQGMAKWVIQAMAAEWLLRTVILGSLSFFQFSSDNRRNA